MAQVINTNMQSLVAQRNLNSTQKGLGTVLERLSTGLRINSAKDDAAGLAISERFTAQIKGLNQAIRNTNDGVSFAQTAEGALSTISDNLQRIRELAVQSANSTNTAADRATLNDEVDALKAEIGRVSDATEFNGQAVLNGALSSLYFQVGANQGQMIGVTGVDARTTMMGNQEYAATNSWSVSEAASLKSTGTIGGIAITAGGATNTYALRNDITVGTSSSLEEAVANINKAIQREIDAGGTEGANVADIGLKAYLRVGNDGNQTIVVTGNYMLDATGTTTQAAFGVTGGSIGGTSNATDVGTNTAVFGATATASAQTLESLDILSRESSAQAMGIVDGALQKVNGLRAQMGAVQNRFEAAMTNMEITSNNMSETRSRIRDADFAAETGRMTQLQVLQQAGISVLAQANMSQQSVLALLQ
jgi:flagellin